MPASVMDTHCSGPGLLASTPRWGFLRRKFWQFFGEKGPGVNYPLPPRVDLKGKTVIVSGSNSGIGKEAAYIFAKWGANVVLACRDPSNAEQHPTDTIKELRQRDSNITEEQLEWWEVDFASLDSVKAFGRKWRQSGRVCDVLCNNAGLSAGRRIITKDGFELTHQVNMLAHCLMTLYILPSMKKAVAPRIVNTASIFHMGGILDFSNFNNERRTSGGLHGVQWYCDSKLKLMIWTVELQRRLSRSDDYRHVIAHAVHPGFVKSGIWDQPSKVLPWPIPALLNFIINRLSITVQQGAMSILHASLRPDLGLPSHVLSTSKSGSKVPLVAEGESARYGGKFLNRVTVSWTRPEAEDSLVRARLWQRVLEDLKVERIGGAKAENGEELASDLPKHTPGLYEVEKS